MPDPTLRSLTLNYYRQQGGQALPVDTLRRRWEVRLDGKKLDLAFDLSQVGPNGEIAPEAVVPGSPKWGEILTDCASRGAVSHRHLVSAPIGNPAGLLAPIVPRGWEIASHRLLGVSLRSAVAFTHRVVYSAPALAGQPDELHHDVLDTSTLERNSVLSDNWASLATIPVDAPGAASGIESLHAQALALVDLRSTERGKELEFSLKAKLAEVERRLTGHYADLRAEVQAREVADLTDRLDRVVSEIQAAMPADLARLRDEGATLAKRLDQAKKAHSISVTSLERIEAHALASERDRYEVTVTTELVGLCIVTFDHVTYEVELVRVGEPEFRVAPLSVSYVPVTGELLAPGCEACGRPAVDPVMTGTGQYGCGTCARPCGPCGQMALHSGTLPPVCHCCGEIICDACKGLCATCGQIGCTSHVEACKGCGGRVCADCRALCSACEKSLCPSCALEIHRRKYCAEHVFACDRCQAEIPFDLVQRCHLTGTTYCVACAMSCVECGQVTRRNLLQPAGRGLVCPRHLVPCGTCGTALLAREAAICASCGRHHCSSEATACPECGLPTCQACTAEGESRCGVCSQLEEVAADDARLEPVRSASGEASAQRWLLARAAGGHVVVEWHGRLGAWGRTALSPDGEVVATCRFGPVAALIQEVTGRIGR